MSAASYRRWGVALAIIGTLVFSFRPILVKLVYVTYPVSPVTLLFLRMSISLPFFLVVAWWLRGDEPRLTALDWAKVASLGFIGYYAASFLDFIGLQFIGAGVGRLIMYLYPTLVLVISFLFLEKRQHGAECCHHERIRPHDRRQPQRAHRLDDEELDHRRNR